MNEHEPDDRAPDDRAQEGRARNDRALSAALRAVAEDEHALGASAAVEQRLVAEVRSIGRSRMRVRLVQLAAAAVLLIAATLPVWYDTLRNREIVDPERAAVAETAREEATDFFPLAYSTVPAPGSYVVRMQVPRTALTSFGVSGFGAPEDVSPTVLADVVVGGDGLARAVRFVHVVRSQRQEQP